MKKYFISILITGMFLAPLLASAALAPEMAVNDAQKTCIVYHPDVYHELQSGWRYAGSQADFAKPVNQRCPSGYQLVKSTIIGIDQLKSEYQGRQLVLDAVSVIIFLLGVWLALKLVKPFPLHGTKGYLKLLGFVGIIFVVLVVIMILRIFVLDGFYPCNYTIAC